jgi:hypothetical protein
VLIMWWPRVGDLSAAEHADELTSK